MKTKPVHSGIVALGTSFKLSARWGAVHGPRARPAGTASGRPQSTVPDRRGLRGVKPDAMIFGDAGTHGLGRAAAMRADGSATAAMGYAAGL